MNKRIKALIVSAVLAVSAICPIGTFAQAESTEKAVADYKNTTLSVEGFSGKYLLNDGNERTFTTADSGKITLHNDEGIASLYVVFNRLPKPWKLSSEETSVQCGENSFLHEFVDVKKQFGKLPKDITLTFENRTSISEIYAFSEGEIPAWVQRWEPPCEKADLILFSGHSDDEQLFFAGTLPYYAGELGLNVQVVYVSHHFDTYERPHEQLDGLWTVGVKNYPIISDFPDLYSETYDQAISAYKRKGYTFDDFSGFFVDQIRRFKPLVAISHDINGEYGHGTHCLAAKALMDASERCTDETFRPESAKKYGVWEPSKVYLHSYEENQITLNWDIPLEKFGGKTAFQMSQEGYRCHKSQHIFPGLKNWLFGSSNQITKASQIKTYSPCLFGLYKTTVGADVVGGDFFENVKTYAVQEQEALQKAEEERLKAEEESRLAAEEESRQAEKERLEAEEESRNAEASSIAEEERIRNENSLLAAIIITSSVVAVIAVVLIVLVCKSRRGKKPKKRRR